MDPFEELLQQENARDEEGSLTGLYLGTVLANNDPHQMGRCRVQVHGIDIGGQDMDYYKWAIPLQSLGGVMKDEPMGPNQDKANGFTSYGTFAIPKVGSNAVIMFLGGRPENPIMVGALHFNDMITGLPAGNRGKGEKDDAGDEDIPRIKNRMDEAFGSGDSVTKDTRGYEVTARAPGQRTGAPDVQDSERKTGDIEGDRSKFGYPKTISQLTPVPDGNPNEPMMYSFTTPGQHTVLMNDDPDNCRIRLRTVSGNQIILDDTNERIYISSGKGNNYIEMDEDGHVDIYSKWRINVHGESDINIKSDKQVNIEGLEGVNIHSPNDIKINTEASLDVLVGMNMYTEVADNSHLWVGTSIFEEAGTDIHRFAGANATYEAGANTNIKSGAAAMYEAGANTNIKSGGNHLETASAIHMNGPSAAPSGTATLPEPSIPANLSNRNPVHEADDPKWRKIDKVGKRSDAVSDAHNDKVPYDPYENKVEGGLNSQVRLPNWRP